MKIKRGDNILIISGKDRGKTGKVNQVFLKTNRVSVEGINMYKRHLKPSRRQPQGGIIDTNRPIPVSNTMVICPHCSKASRISHQLSEKSKLRLCQKCHESVDQE